MTPAYSDLPSVAEHANASLRDYDGADFATRPSLALVAPFPLDRFDSRSRAFRLDGIGENR